MNGHVIEGTPIAVDFWRILECPRAKLFFLSHVHDDHIKGLTPSWRLPIYTSPVSAKLLQHYVKVPGKLIRELEVGMSHVILLGETGEETITVTLIDAHHCPGSVMFLFEGYFGRILYTGDFRYDVPMQQEALLNLCSRVDRLYLDNTYCSPECVHPTREEAAEMVLRLIRAQPPDTRIFLGLRRVGKEELLLKIARELQEWITVDSETYFKMKLLDMADVFAVDPENCRIEVLPFHVCRSSSFRNPGNGPFLVILPTSILAGLHKGPYGSQKNFHPIPYSDHSSYNELLRFVERINPRHIFPIVTGSVARTDFAVFDRFLDATPSKSFSTPACVENWHGLGKTRVRSKFRPKLSLGDSKGVTFIDSGKRKKVEMQDRKLGNSFESDYDSDSDIFRVLKKLLPSPEESEDIPNFASTGSGNAEATTNGDSLPDEMHQESSETLAARIQSNGHNSGNNSLSCAEASKSTDTSLLDPPIKCVTTHLPKQLSPVNRSTDQEPFESPETRSQSDANNSGAGDTSRVEDSDSSATTPLSPKASDLSLTISPMRVGSLRVSTARSLSDVFFNEDMWPESSAESDVSDATLPAPEIEESPLIDTPLRNNCPTSEEVDISDAAEDQSDEAVIDVVSMTSKDLLESDATGCRPQARNSSDVIKVTPEEEESPLAVSFVRRNGPSDCNRSEEMDNTITDVASMASKDQSESTQCESQDIYDANGCYSREYLRRNSPVSWYCPCVHKWKFDRYIKKALAYCRGQPCPDLSYPTEHFCPVLRKNFSAATLPTPEKEESPLIVSPTRINCPELEEIDIFDTEEEQSDDSLIDVVSMTSKNLPESDNKQCRNQVRNGSDVNKLAPEEKSRLAVRPVRGNEPSEIQGGNRPVPWDCPCVPRWRLERAIQKGLAYCRGQPCPDFFFPTEHFCPILQKAFHS